MECLVTKTDLQPLIHLLLPLCFHWIAEELTVSVLVDVITDALCPDESTCSEAIYFKGLQQTAVGIFKMFILPFLGQLANDYGWKPLLFTVSTSLFPLDRLSLNQCIHASRISKEGFFTFEEESFLKPSTRQITLLLSSIWTQPIASDNVPKNCEAIAHTYSLVMLFSQAKFVIMACFWDLCCLVMILLCVLWIDHLD